MLPSCKLSFVSPGFRSKVDLLSFQRFRNSVDTFDVEFINITDKNYVISTSTFDGYEVIHNNIHASGTRHLLKASPIFRLCF